MKIYVVVAEQACGKSIACDWVGDDPYELTCQEVFLSREDAEEVVKNEQRYEPTKKVSIHEFEV